jgi:hypothetical protein
MRRVRTRGLNLARLSGSLVLGIKSKPCLDHPVLRHFARPIYKRLRRALFSLFLRHAEDPFVTRPYMQLNAFMEYELCRK